MPPLSDPFRNASDQPWTPAYAFTEMEFTLRYFEVMNFFTSRRSDCPLTSRLLVVKFLRTDDDGIYGKLILDHDRVKKNVGGKSILVQTCTTEKERQNRHNSRDSLVVTHPTTNLPACGLNTARRRAAAARPPGELADEAALPSRDQGELGGEKGCFVNGVVIGDRFDRFEAPRDKEDKLCPRLFQEYYLLPNPNMFATLRFGKTQEPVYVESRPYHSGQPYQFSGHQRSACNACREKKLKCTGHKEGCDRCRSKQIACTYLPFKQDRPKPRGSRPASVIHSSPPPAMTPRSEADDRTRKRKEVDTAKVSLAIDNGLPGTPPQSDLAGLTDIQNKMSAYREERSSLSPQEDRFPFLRSDCLPSFGSPEDERDNPLTLEDSLPTQQVATPSRFMMLDMVNFDSVLSGMPLGSGAVDCLDPLAPSKPEAHSIAALSFDDENDVSSGVSGCPTPLVAQVVDRSLDPLCADAPAVPQDILPNSAAHSPRGVWDTFAPANPTPPMPCACTQNVLELHNEVEKTRWAGTSSMSLGDSLVFQRVLLRKGSKILACENCTRSSAIAMLLITICDHLLHLSRGMSTRLWNWFMHRPPSHPRRGTGFPNVEVGMDRGHSRKGKLNTCQTISIGTYSVEDRIEQVLLISKAIEYQVRMLFTFLTRLRKNATCANWNEHLTRIQALSARTQDQIVHLRDSSASVVNDISDISHSTCLRNSSMAY
ncbi:uncharacterized protein KD926_003260 [Aspergillus affinis]|uniref:uncharacterized protein n=1 Tax=Aspergillus affinis TaxID=1070780 RepID=UPI0022FF3892|nr:uncharacterized protein KD926_003260 [Aspergillus affinis]KAI9035558.1 hypothetical protein KD926_003260 [Aspergillus affinis]